MTTTWTSIICDNNFMNSRQTLNIQPLVDFNGKTYMKMQSRQSNTLVGIYERKQGSQIYERKQGSQVVRK